MKKIFLIITILALAAFGKADGKDSLDVQKDSLIIGHRADPKYETGSNEAIFEAANKAFMNGQYPLAVATYETILSKGLHSAKVYYNLGNAYFQQNQIGKAVLNYYRAKNLAPFDSDIEYNLDLAKARTKDKIEPVPEFFLVRWVAACGGLLTSNWWATLAVIFFALTAAGVGLWLVSNRLAMRKLGFAVGLVMMIFTGCAIAFASAAAEDQYDSRSAVIINTAAPVKSSPSVAGKDIFVLHEGTKVEILQNIDNFSEIELEDGNKGWIAKSAIEII